MGICIPHTRLVTSNRQTLATPMVTASSTNVWLSSGRLNTYLQLAKGHHDDAMSLYSWNCDLAGACARDLGHLEVAIRNAYHHALDQKFPGWLWSHRAYASASVSGIVFDDASHHVPAQKLKDLRRLNKGALGSLFNARKKAGVTGNHAPTLAVPDGKILANLTFGFWSFLTEPLRANILWNQALGNVPGIPSRAWIHPRMLELNNFRNRVAHMEPLLGPSSALAHNLKRMDEVLSVIVKPDVLDWISATSLVPGLYREGVNRGVLSAPSTPYLNHALN